jgi:hypothetical protein
LETIVIGITGKARVGKDTLAGLLLSLTGGRGVRMSFADPIREFIASLTGYSVATLADGPLKEAPIDWLDDKSPRQMMQTLGTEWGRNMIDPDLWIKVAGKRLERVQHDVPLVVFPDVRFDNEAKLIRRMGGTVVHLLRSGAAQVNAHASEAGISSGMNDWQIVNDGSMTDLREQAGTLLSRLARQKG